MKKVNMIEALDELVAAQLHPISVANRLYQEINALETTLRIEGLKGVKEFNEEFEMEVTNHKTMIQVYKACVYQNLSKI
jgi:hypothetical protein